MLTHQINDDVFKVALAREGLDVDTLATKLELTSQQLSKWLTEGYPANRVIDFARALNIKGVEFRKLIKAPIYTVLRG